MAVRPDLVLFTSAFPYDGSESVLRGELDVTSERFGRIFVVPSQSGRAAAGLPARVSVVDLGRSDGFSSSEKRGALASWITPSVLAVTLRNPENWRPYTVAARSFLDLLATNLLKARAISRWAQENELRDAIFYDYWFENSTLALAMLRNTGVIRCAVSRAHRFDVFDTSWKDLRRVPFREYKARHLDAIFPVSEDAASYMREKEPREAEKIRVARLGVPRAPSYPEEAARIPTVVSCSSLIARKRVHLIPDVLALCRGPLHWIHFGDGPDREHVEIAATRLPPSVTWELRGWVDNAVVRNHYASSPVGAFLSLSSSEGIPVSMMEAQSFGIPIVAVAAGAISELVTGDTGVLLPEDAPVTAVATALEQALIPGAFDRQRIRDRFGQRYEATQNYREFADEVIAVWERSTT